MIALIAIAGRGGGHLLRVQPGPAVRAPASRVYALVSNSVNVRSGRPGPDRRDRRRRGDRASRRPARPREITLHADRQRRCRSTRDATVRIRDRLFLEGSYYLELDPGTPERADRCTTAARSRVPDRRRPVQFYKVLSTFDVAARTNLKHLAGHAQPGLQPGAGAARVRQRRRRAEGRRSRSWRRCSRTPRWITRALRGTQPGDVERLLELGLAGDRHAGRTSRPAGRAGHAA